MKMKFLLAIAMMFAFVVGVDAQSYYVEADGIGPVRTGVNVKTLSASVVGLYDKVDVISEYDEFEDMTVVTANFYLGGQQRFYARAEEDGTIFDIRLLTNDLKTKSGVYEQMPARKFILLPGVTTNFNPQADEYYQVSFEIDNVPVAVDLYSFSTAGMQKIKKAQKTGVAPKFVPADFNAEAVIVLGGFMM